VLSLRDITVDGFDKLSQFLSASPTPIGAYLDTMSIPKLDVLIITGELNNVWSTSAKPGFQSLRTLNLVAMGRYVALHSMP